MKFVYSALFTFIFLVSSSLNAQKDLRVYKASGDRLMTNVTVQPGFTVYSLTKAIGISEADFVVANPGLSTVALELNTSISIPINPDKISLDPLALDNPIKLKYTVGKGETLFSICNVFARQTTTDIITLNKKSTPELAINETILLGYIDWPYGAVPPTYTIIEEHEQYRETPTSSTTTSSTTTSSATTEQISLVSLKDVIIKELPNEIALDEEDELSLSNHIKMTKGIAVWDTRGGTDTDLVVMHPRAKIDSQIEIYNPMLKRSVKATVVGSIPENSYPHDASVVLSPAVAKALGALDQRFLVEMTYIDME